MSSKYNMDHKKRGTALVINIRNFEANTHNERMWSDSDIKRLKETLNYLEFDLKLNENLTKQQIEEKIREQANISHADSDCFLCVIMSHGNADKIVASDNKEISFEDYVTKKQAENVFLPSLSWRKSNGTNLKIRSIKYKFG